MRARTGAGQGALGRRANRVGVAAARTRFVAGAGGTGASRWAAGALLIVAALWIPVVGCQKSAPAPAGAPAPAAGEGGAPPAAAATPPEGTAAEVPVAAGAAPDAERRARAAAAATAAAARAAAPAQAADAGAAVGGAERAEQGTADCESGKQFDKLAIARQKADMARDAAVRANAALDEASRAVDALLVEALQRQTTECAGKALDAACVGAASGDPRRCTAPGLIGDLGACRLLAVLRGAAVSKDAAPCADLDGGTPRAICVGLASGVWECGDGADSNQARVCNLLRDGTEPDCAGADKGEVCATFWMLEALAGKSAAVCLHIDDEGTRSQCDAIASKDMKLCRFKGPAPASCRDVLLESNVAGHKVDGGTAWEAQIRVANIHEVPARCTARVTVRMGDRAESSERDLGAVEPGPEIRTVSWELGVLPLQPALLVTTTCEWSDAK